MNARRSAALLILAAVLADGDQQRATLELGVPLEPGPHSLTVVLTTPEGEVSTSTVLYSVEG